MAFKKIGALWLRDGKNGKFMSGTVQEEVPAGAKILVFKNTHKKDEKHPDYTINVAEDDQPAPKNEYQQAPARAPAGPPPDNDIPFAPNR